MTALLFLALALFLLVAFNTWGWPRVARRSPPPAGTVSLLIPARNEEGRIGPALEAARAQDASVVEVLVYDDHSTDGTAGLVRAAAARDPRVRLVPADPLPEGWCGKPFACARLAAAAKGDWLLFLDADARLSPGAAARMAAEAERRAVTFLSCWPGLDLRGFWERALMPLLNYVVFTLFPAPLSLTSNRPSLGLAHGACILARRAEYAALGGHGRVKSELFEDTALARAWRAQGLRGICLDGQDEVTVRMYDSLGAIWQGFQKNLYPAFHRESRFWLFLAYHFFLGVAPFVVVAAQAAAGTLHAAAAGAAAAVLAARALQAARFRYPAWSVLLHPVATCGLLALALVSRHTYRSGSGVSWKGRSYRRAPPH